MSEALTDNEIRTPDSSPFQILVKYAIPGLETTIKGGKVAAWSFFSCVIWLVLFL